MSSPTTTRIQDLSPEQRALLALKLRKNRAERSEAADEVLQIQADETNRHEPFPLTDLQQAYWLGRTITFEIGSIPSKAYLELACTDLELARVEAALNRLIQSHEMLRMVVAEDGQQQILPEVPAYTIQAYDLLDQSDAAQQEHLESVYETLLYDQRSTAEWPLFQIEASQLSDSLTHLHLCLDLLNFDAGSIALLFRELGRLYRDPSAAINVPELSFRDYLLAEEKLAEAGLNGDGPNEAGPNESGSNEAGLIQRSRAYWESRLSTLPPAPELPLHANPVSIERPRFKRIQATIDVGIWSRLKTRATDVGLTPTGLLLSVYAEVLSRWSNNAHFCINIPVFNRLPVHPQINDIIGDFTTVNLLEVDHTLPESFEARARRIQKQLMDDLDHRYMNGVQVLRELARLDRATFAKGIPVVFTSLLGHGYTDALKSVGEISRSINQTAQVWTDLHVDEGDEGLIIKWDAVEGLFPPQMIEDMLEAYCQLLHQLAAGDDAWQTVDRSLLPLRQREMRAALNDTAAPIPDGLLHSYLAEKANAHPNRVAIITPERQLTFNELHRAANRVGHALRAEGAKPNQLVAIVMDKGWEQVVAAYGVMTAGAAYVPIDPEFPQERIWQLLERSQSTQVLTQSWIDEKLAWPDTVQRFAVDDAAVWADYAESFPSPVQQPDDLAYVLYTSGSTGLPKGVMLTHRCSVNRMVDVVERFELTAGDICMGVTSLQHDLSIFDIFWMLAGAGGAVVIPSAALRRDPAHWADLMIEHQVTAWNSVPAFMEMFVEYLQHRQSQGNPMPDSLRLAMHSGDWVPVSLPQRIQSFMPKAQVISLGGPTETTTWDVNYPITAVDPNWTSIPYGRPMTNASYHVLNEALQECPDYVTGELYIGGVGLARGYWQDEQQTDARFITHPKSGERLYRSGDTGRLLPDGNIEFMGRADFQVKIRGMRIELGEIEAILEGHAQVRSAVVSTHGDPKGKDKLLVGYVVPITGEEIAAEALRDYVAEQLPAYMVPTQVMVLTELPLTRNGKVDRRHLPAPELAPPPAADAVTAASSGSSGGRAVNSDTEERVAALVASLLNIPQPDAAANLMGLGANSIDMVRLGNQLEREFGFRPGMDQIFRLQTIDAIASYVNDNISGAPGSNNGAGTQQTGTGMIGVNSEVAELINSYDVLLLPEDRDALKAKRLNLRQDMDGRAWTALPPVLSDPTRMERLQERQSRRKFGLKPIPLVKLARLLSELAITEADGKPRYLYASAGGVYPNQTYLHIKPGRVAGLEGGIYYYHPGDHRLVQISNVPALPRDIHVPYVNTPTFDEAAFSIFFISQLSAIAPIYGEYSVHFSTIEAGIMAHALEIAAPTLSIGLCQIGSVDFDQIRDLFELDKSHLLIHTMLGGMLDDAPEEEADAAEQGDNKMQKTARVLERMKNLSPEQIKAMLAAQKS